MRAPRLPRFFRIGLYLVYSLTASVAVASAQSSDQAPAHIDIVDGSATLERDGQLEPAAQGMPFVSGDRLRTERGRVEILLPDGSTLDLDEYAIVDLQSPTLLRVTAGRVLLTVAGAANPSAATRYQLDTPVASALTDGPGEFRVAALSTPSGLETEFAVLRGSGSISTERGTMPVRAGERSLARDNQAPSYPQAFNSARFDAFDRWASAHRDARLGTAASAQYLPSDLRVYGSSFDRHGAWQYDAAYGNVWYPSVDGDWRPYYDGYWAPVPSYGWTWIGYDSWSWPTHHYGRWGFARSRWFWIPDRRWSSAWVSWGAAPGYVSWCPLGYDNRPVFALSINVGTPWIGWTVVPRTHFGWYSTRQWAVSGERVRANTPFAVQRVAPVALSRARPRDVIGAAAVAGVAVPRGSADSRRPAIGNDSRSGVANQSSVISRQSSPDRGPVAIPRDRIPPTIPRGSNGDPRSTTGGDARLSGGDARVSPALRRSMSPGRGLPTTDRGTGTIDRSRPSAERSQADVWLKQPLPDPSRGYQRNPSTAGVSPGVPGQVRPAQGVPSGGNGDTPRWQTYSSPTYSGGRVAPRRDPSPPASAPPADSPSASPRRPQYSGDRSPGTRSEAPPQRQAAPPPRDAPPPASAPAPSYRAPAAAEPRSAPRSGAAPPSGGAPSGSARGEGRQRTSASGDSGGTSSDRGARRRRP